MKGLVAAIVLLASVAHAAAQTPQVSAVQGRVVRWGTNEPVGKASVELRRIDSATPVPFVATTNGDGAFVFASVPAGQYRVVASRPGYVNAEYGQRWPNGAGTPLTLPPGRAVSNVPIPMLQTGAISGVTRDGAGAPLGNVEVQALKASYQSGRRVLTVVQSVQSDDRGEYRLFWLTPGKYFVAARHADLSMSPIRTAGISMVGGGTGLGNGPVRYQRFQSGGDNAAGSAFNFDRQKPARERYMAVYYPNTTDESSAAAVEVTPAGESRAIDFTVAPISMQRIHGRVVYEASNEPAMSARVQWITPTGMSSNDADTLMGPMQGAVAVECCDGAFDMTLPPGAYTLVAAVNNRIARLALNVGDNDIDNVVLAIGPVINLKGRVTFEGHELTADENAALRLTVSMDPPVPGLDSFGYSNVLTNGAVSFQTGRGDFRINLSPLLQSPGVSRFVMPPLPQARPGLLANAYVKSIRLGGADLLNDGLHLDAEPQQSVEIVLSNDTGAIEGRVINGDRQPVPNVAVALVPDAARRSRVDLVKTTSSDSTGRFRVDGIPPGNYLAFAFDGVDDGEWRNPEFLRALEPRGVPVTVAAGVSPTVEVTAVTP